MHRMAALLVLFLFSLTSHAQSVRILSWNVFMLPKPIKFSLQVTRAHRIVETLNSLPHEVVVLQEAFDRHFRSHIKKDLKDRYPYMYYLGKENLVYPFMSSGVFVLSKIPFKALDYVFFDWCGTADCYASKGVVGLQFKKFQLFATHLQSLERFSLSRFHQTNQIIDLMQKHESNGMPQLLVGDLNIDGRSSEFEETIHRMDLTPLQLSGEVQNTFGHKNECYKTDGDKFEWLDHVLYRDQGEGVSFTEMKSLNFTFERKGKICSLSDHHPVETSVSFANQEFQRPHLLSAGRTPAGRE